MHYVGNGFAIIMIFYTQKKEKIEREKFQNSCRHAETQPIQFSNKAAV